MLLRRCADIGGKGTLYLIDRQAFSSPCARAAEGCAQRDTHDEPLHVNQKLSEMFNLPVTQPGLFASLLP